MPGQTVLTRIPARGQVACRGHGHPDDAALGRRVRDLAGLTFETGHRRGVDDDTALPVRVRGLGGRYRRGGQPHHVEGADQVDRDDLLVGAQVMRRAVACHRTCGPGDTRAAHGGPQRAPRPGHGRHRGGDRCLIGHVGAREQAADVSRDRVAAFLSQVGDHDEGPGLGQLAGGGLAEAARTAGDDCAGSVQFHGRRIACTGYGSTVATARIASRVLAGRPARCVSMSRCFAV